MVEIPRPFDRATPDKLPPGIQVRFRVLEVKTRLDSGFRRNDKNKSRRLARAAASTYLITRCRDTKRNRNDPIPQSELSRGLDSSWSRG